MNTPADEEQACTDAASQRALNRGVWWMAAVIIAYVCLLLVVHVGPLHVLPKSAKTAISLGGAAGICIGALGFAFWAMSRIPSMHQMRPAARRYMMRFLPAMFLYVVVFEAATWFYMHRHPTGLAAVLAGLAPSVPVLFAIRAMALLLREETDEYLRARALEVWAVATALMLGLCTVWGFLDQFEVVPHLPLWAVFPLWAVCIFPAQIIVQKRHS